MLRSGDDRGAPPSVPPEPSRVAARRGAPRPFLGGARELSTNLGLLLASVTVVLLATEAGTRLFSRIGPSLLVTDPVVGKHYVPGFQGRVFVDEAGREVGLRFNQEGFRGPDRPRAKPSGARRVAVIGDSIISAVATDEEKTLVRRLETSLQRWRPDVRFEVFNFGVSSSSTGQELALYRRLVSTYQPDVVLLAFFVGNDFADNSQRLTRAPRIYFELGEDGVPREASVPAAPGALSRWLNRHSRFYVWQKRAFRVLRSSGHSLSRSLPPVWRVFEPPERPELAEAWELLGGLLRQFAADVEADGSRFVVVLVPTAHQIHDDLWAELATEAHKAGRSLDRDQPPRRLEQVTREAGIPLLDLTPVFREATAARSPNGTTSLYLHGRYHLSEEGNRLAAEAVFHFLRGQVVNVESRPQRRTPASPDAPVPHPDRHR